MHLIDTHTHQYYNPEYAECMHRAIQAGVTGLVLPNVDIETIEPLFKLSREYPENCFPLMGLHPCSVKEDYKEVLNTIYQHTINNKIYGIGEIGLDFYWDKTFTNEQISAFKTQINWAKDINLPIAIHCRNAFDEILNILQEEQDGSLRGVLHCFSGTLEQSKEVIDLGLMLGIGGVVTYKKSNGLDEVVAQTDLKHIILETDSPYLTPVPHRGKPNESSYLVYIAQKVADLHQTSIENIANITTQNAKRLFNIK